MKKIISDKLKCLLEAHLPLDISLHTSDLLEDDTAKIEWSRCKSNLKRTTFFSYILLMAQASNMLFTLFTDYHVGYKAEYFCGSCYLTLLCIIYLIFIKRNSAKMKDLVKCRRILHSFWGLFLLGALWFCNLEFLEKMSSINYVLLLVSIAIFPILNAKEMSVFGGVAIVPEGFLIFSSHSFSLEQIQLYILAALASFLMSHILYKSFIAVSVMHIQLEDAADTDSLTGLCNRRGFDRKLSCVWIHGVRNKSCVMVSMIDIDFFKNYNDAFGHVAGDQCLKEVSETIAMDFKRKTDIVSRYGGEEFVIVATGLTDVKIVEFMNRIIKRVEALKIPAGETSVSDFVTVSIGTVSAQAEPGMNFSDLYRRADRQLSKAKQNGRNILSFNGVVYKNP